MAKSFLIRYAKALFSLCLLDSLWLYTQMDAYKVELGAHLAPTPSLPPIVAFYLLYAFAICVLVSESHRPTREVCLRALLFGLAAYGTYDLTNAGTLKDFSLLFAIRDMCWGSILTLLSALASRFTYSAKNSI